MELCPKCRWSEPCRLDGALLWRCAHRQIEIVEKTDGRLVATRLPGPISILEDAGQQDREGSLVVGPKTRLPVDG